MLRTQASLEAEINSVKHAKDMRRELEKQVSGLKEEIDQLRQKSKHDSIQTQKLQDDLIGLEKVCCFCSFIRIFIILSALYIHKYKYGEENQKHNCYLRFSSNTHQDSSSKRE